VRIIPVLTFILLMLVGFGFWINHSLSGTADELGVKFSHIEQAVKQNDWPSAGKQISLAEKSWSKSKSWWAVIIDHQEIDQIEIAFSRIKSYIEAKNSGLSLGELAMLRHSIEHIPQKEAVSIENIL